MQQLFFFQNIPAHQSQRSKICKTFRADVPPASSVTKRSKNSNYRYRERGPFMDFTDTKPENNWHQFYTNYKWIGTKWKAFGLFLVMHVLRYCRLICFSETNSILVFLCPYTECTQCFSNIHEINRETLSVLDRAQALYGRKSWGRPSTYRKDNRNWTDTLSQNIPKHGTPFCSTKKKKQKSNSSWHSCTQVPFLWCITTVQSPFLPSANNLALPCVA